MRGRLHLWIRIVHLMPYHVTLVPSSVGTVLDFKGHLFKNVCAWMYIEQLKENSMYERVIKKKNEHLP